ncbi:MAG: sulfotransferase [Chloroflexota bacterium]
MNVQIAEIVGQEALKVPALQGKLVIQEMRLEGYILLIAGVFVGAQVDLDSFYLVSRTQVFTRSPAVYGEQVDGAPRKCYFRFLTSVLFLPAEFELYLRVTDAAGRSYDILSITGRHCLPRLAVSGELQPLLVSAGRARSGTTYLMRLLAGHPQICAVQEYPYESRHALYWMQVCAVASGPADLRNSVTPQSMLDSKFLAGRNPYFDPRSEHFQWMANQGVEMVCANTKHIIAEFYRTLAEQIGKESPRYFLEKFPNHFLPQLFINLYAQPREVFLVRDLRDVFCSMLAFNQRRGHEDFGFEAKRTPAEMLLIHLEEFWKSYHKYLKRYRPGERIVIRYEDLVEDTPAVLRKLLSRLDLDCEAALIAQLVMAADGDRSLRSQHMTSEDKRASVGRWRRDLPPDLQALAAERLGDYCERFGYEQR